jgi:hypothetical protein
MKVLTKKALLLFTAILLFVSAFNGRYILSDYSYYSKEDSKTELLLTSQNSDLFPLNRPEVPSFSLLKKLPVIYFRHQNNDLFSCILSTNQEIPEKKLEFFDSQEFMTVDGEISVLEKWESLINSVIKNRR